MDSSRVVVMYKCCIILVVHFLIVSATFPAASIGAVNQSAKAGRITPKTQFFDPVEFIKQFKIGMTYTEVQAALPKEAEQDVLSYITTEEVFVLSLDLGTDSDWSASFKFDTLDTSLRRPELLVEMSCTASVSPNSESFDAIVNKVTAAFGEPVKMDRSEGKFKQAGWRVSGGSVLMLEYSGGPGAAAGRGNVEFIIRKNPRRTSGNFKAIA
jgi:hypothetical protein